MISFLFIEVLLECCEFVLLQDAALPPRLNEAEAVAHQLNKCSRDAEQAHPQAAVLYAGVYEDDERIEHKR